MNSREATDVIRLVAGYWPTPEMGEDEIRVWTRSLSTCSDVNLAAQIVDSLARSGRDFRPTAGQFSAEYKAREPRSSGRQPEDAPALPMTTEHRTREEWMAEAKRQLAKARGPLAKDYKTIVGRPGSRSPTDSAQSRAFAAQRVAEDAEYLTSIGRGPRATEATEHEVREESEEP